MEKKKKIHESEIRNKSLMNKICKCLSFVTLNIQQFVPWWETSHHVQWFTEHGVSENEEIFFMLQKCALHWMNWICGMSWMCVYLDKCNLTAINY